MGKIKMVKRTRIKTRKSKSKKRLRCASCGKTI